jgi:hypothetical protein
VRTQRAWESINADREVLNFDQYGIKQVDGQLQVCEGTARQRMAETYIWLIVPRQAPGGPLEFDALKVQGKGAAWPSAPRSALTPTTW